MPGSTTSVFGEQDDYQAALRLDAEVDLLVIGRGEFQARLTRIVLPHLSISAGDEHLARIALITLPSHLMRVSLPVRGRSSLLWGGIASRPNEIVTHRPGQRVLERTEGPCRWRTISLPTRFLARFGRVVTGAAPDVPRGECRWQPTPRALRSLADLHDDAIRASTVRPSAAAGVQAASGLEQQLIDAVIECLTEKPAYEGAGARGRQAEIMSRFEDQVRACSNLTPPIPDICAALEVPDRTLRAYCRAHLGMAPKRYLHLRRLQLARRALRANGSETANVAVVARRYGFSGLGRFAAYYREQYGELPSITLRDGAGDVRGSA